MRGRNVLVLAGMLVVTVPARVVNGSQPAGVPASPQQSLLVAIAAGHRDSDTVLRYVRDCTRGSAYTVGCEAKVGLVLAKLGEDENDGLSRMLQVLQAALLESRSQDERLRVQEIERQLKGVNGGDSRRTVAAQMAAPPKELSQEEISRYAGSYALENRLSDVVRFRLGGDTRQRVRLAFQNALAGECSDILKGELDSVCRRVSVAVMRATLLRVGLEALWEGIGFEDLAGVYGGLGREELERVADSVSKCGDDYLVGYGLLLRRWAKRPPSKWEAWAEAAVQAAW